ncbi:hypothetical protein, variant [Puccinia triticina 1-1 BBBD Race 1]|nr:hypothetical protein, variant [Puccinia triticina 1-1 BBBD Race 1]
MFFRFSVVALVCSITHVWGMNSFVPIKDVGDVGDIDRTGRLPFMMISPYDKSDLDVYYSISRPTHLSQNVRHTRLNKDDVLRTLEDQQEVDAAKILRELPRGWHMVVDRDFYSRAHWDHWRRQFVISETVTRKMADLINTLCTRKLDDRPSITIVPFENHVHIQYPVITSDQEIESYILRKDVQTERFITALSHAKPRDTELEGQILSASRWNTGKYDPSILDPSSPFKRWLHRDPRTEFQEIIKDGEAKAIQQAFAHMGGFPDLPGVPVYIGSAAREF